MSEASFDAIVLAAGKGTRMRSKLPKVLHQLAGQSLIERAVRAVNALSQAEISSVKVRLGKVIVVVGYGAELVEKELKGLAADLSIEIECVLQEEQNGTGHAAQVALPAVRSEATSVLIMPGDMPLVEGAHLAPVVESHFQNDEVLSFLTCQHPEPASFGRIVRDAAGRVQAIVEARDCSEQQLSIQEINTSVYLAKKPFLEESLRKIGTDNAQGELYLTDIVGIASETGQRLEAVVTADYMGTSGANSISELTALENIRRRAIVEAFMENGVRFEDSERVYIDEGVSIGSDSFIGAGSRLQGKTTLGENVVLEGDSLIKDAKLSDNVTIKLSCSIESSTIAEGCSVGPFARIRPGTVLDEEVKVGNFVETKKAHLRKGVKAGHLSYLGDAEIGEETNIGAGTITCNYDGKNKHLTEIGEGSFIGSNSCLVAPVRLGKGVYIGAGSTITKTVPGGALGIARAKQSNIKDWSKKQAD